MHSKKHSLILTLRITWDYVNLGTSVYFVEGSIRVPVTRKGVRVPAVYVPVYICAFPAITTCLTSISAD